MATVPIWRRALVDWLARMGIAHTVDGHLRGRTAANPTATEAAVYTLEAVSRDLGDLQRELAGTLADLNTQAFEHSLRGMVSPLGESASRVKLTNHEVLAALQQRANQSAESMVHTYVQDMLKFAKAADDAGVPGSELPKLLEDWDAARAAWKDTQVARTETAVTRGIAKREFISRSGVRGHATFGDSLICKLCQAVAAGNPYDLDDPTVGSVPHVSCLDDWNIHVNSYDHIWMGD